MRKKQDSDMAVITRAKDLCDYVLQVTEKSPKRFRFTLVTRMQNYALSIVENEIMANEVYMDMPDRESIAAALTQRRILQKNGMRDMKMLGYLAHVSKKHGCLTEKQFEYIAGELYVCQRMLVGWFISDDRRYAEAAGMQPMRFEKDETERPPRRPRKPRTQAQPAQDVQDDSQQTQPSQTQPPQPQPSQARRPDTRQQPEGPATAAQERAVQEPEDDTVPWKQ